MTLEKKAIDACCNGDIRVLSNLKRAGINVNYIHEETTASLLHTASYYGQVQPLCLHVHTLSLDLLLALARERHVAGGGKQGVAGGGGRRMAEDLITQLLLILLQLTRLRQTKYPISRVISRRYSNI